MASSGSLAQLGLSTTISVSNLCKIQFLPDQVKP